MDQKRWWTCLHSMQYPLKRYDCEHRQPSLQTAVTVWKPWLEMQQQKHFFVVLFPALLAWEMMVSKEPLKDDVVEMQQSLETKMSFGEL